MKKFRMWGLCALLVFSLVFPLLFPNPAVTTVAIFTLILMVAATGWNLFSGYTRYLSLGHAAFYGLGAYILAIICQAWHVPGGWLPLLLLPVVGLVTGLCSVPLGWIALQTRRFTFMVITIAIFALVAQLPDLSKQIAPGMSDLSLPFPLWGADFFNLPFYYTALILLFLALLVGWWIRISKIGLSLRAIGDDEDRALGLGVETYRYKLTAMVISASFVGMAGALNALFIGVLAPSAVFDHTSNIAFPVAAFLGGIGTLEGPLIGALLTMPVQQYMLLYGEIGWSFIFYGVLLLFIVLVLPEGIGPTLRRRFAFWQVQRFQTTLRETPIPETDSMALAALSMVIPAVPREVLGNTTRQLPRTQSQQLVWSPVAPRKLLHTYKSQRLVPLSPKEDLHPPLSGRDS